MEAVVMVPVIPVAGFTKILRVAVEEQLLVAVPVTE
jgi:hypothetical protein